MKTQLRVSIKMLLAMAVLTGVLYPLLITGIAQALFPGKSNGSIVRMNGNLAGSRLIGQRFNGAAYFHGRPSANDYNPMPSGGSNWGPIADTLRTIIDANRTAFIRENTLNPNGSVPTDIITASASGLDPDISPEAARMQVNRVAFARHFTPEQTEKLHALVERMVTPPQFGILGEARVNVLRLNLALDSLK